MSDFKNKMVDRSFKMKDIVLNKITCEFLKFNESLSSKLNSL